MRVAVSSCVTWSVMRCKARLMYGGKVPHAQHHSLDAQNPNLTLIVKMLRRRRRLFFTLARQRVARSCALSVLIISGCETDIGVKSERSCVCFPRL